jgi:hypothetical protein
LRQFFCKVVFVAIAEASSSGGNSILEVIELITIDGTTLEEARLFAEGVEHFGRRVVCWSVADLVTVGDGHRHFLLLLFDFL